MLNSENSTTKLNFEDKSSVISNIKEKILKIQDSCNNNSFFLGELSVSLPVKYSNGKSVHGKIAEIYCDDAGILRADLVLSGSNRDSEIFFGCNIEQLNTFDLNSIDRILSINSFDFLN